jgi:trimethylamine---corrinoid protein Co-methyltransferase
VDIRLQDLPDNEFEILHESMLRLLFEYGVLFENEEAQRLLDRDGNEVDAEGRVHLKPKFVESMLAMVPKDGFMFYGRDESRTLHAAPNQMSFRPSTGAPFILDYETGRPREATMDDARIMATLADALEGYGMVNSVVNPPGAPGGIGTGRLFVNAHRYSLKPSDVTVMTREEVNLIGRICAAIRGGEKESREKPLVAVDVAMITPLRCAGEQVEAFLECAKWGLPVEALTQPVVGLSGPVTLAGSSVLAMAEIVAALCLVYQVAPGLGFVNATRVSLMNMYTSEFNLGAPELGMASVLVSAWSARYNIPCDSYGFGTYDKAPGSQASMEKTLSGMLMALGHPYMITGGGILDNALITSPEQLVIDNEAIRMVQRICKPMTIDKESIAIDVLLKAKRGNELLVGEEHTVRHLRAGEVLSCGLRQWFPSAPGEEVFPDLNERAHKRKEEILASHKVPPFDSVTEKQIKRLLGD